MTTKPLDYHRAIFDDRDLTSSQRLVALAVCRHAGADGTRSHPGNDLLCKETGYSLNTVKSALKALRELGWIVQTYNGRGGNQSKASEYALAIPKDHHDPLSTDPQRAMVDTQRSMVDTQRSTIGTTDASRNAPRDAPTRRTARTTIKEREEREVITQEDIDYRDISRAGFTEVLGESFSPSLESLAKLQQEWPDPDKIPYDHLVAGCLGWNQYKGMMNGQTTQDVGIDSLARILGYHLKIDDVKSLAIKGWQQINRYEEENGYRVVDDSVYDPKACYQDVTYDVGPDYAWVD
jgi:Helix-turn-helix domain